MHAVCAWSRSVEPPRGGCRLGMPCAQCVRRRGGRRACSRGKKDARGSHGVRGCEPASPVAAVRCAMRMLWSVTLRGLKDGGNEVRW